MNSKPGAICWAVAVLCVLVASIGRADTFRNKKTGEVLKGRAVSTAQKDGKEVVFVRLADGETRFLSLNEWYWDRERAAPAQPEPKPDPEAQFTYFVIPVKGVIGQDFTAGRMELYLEEVAKVAPSAVVLVLDTPGGNTDAAEEIVQVMIYNDQLRFVAVVRRALAAGVPIAMACKDIFVTKTATIGAGSAYRTDCQGRPLRRSVANEHRRAWQATCRMAAEHGGHSPLIPEAMMDQDSAFTMRELDGRIVIERGGQGELLKPRGELLTLTGREAIRCGLARGLAKDLDSVGRFLDMAGWDRVRPAEDAALPIEAGAFSPAALCLLLRSKATSLGFLTPSGETTTLQRQVGSKRWHEWFAKQKFIGREVRWHVVLTEARIDKTRLAAFESDVMNAKFALTVAQRELQWAEREQAKLNRRGASGSGGISPRMLAAAQQAVAIANAKVERARKHAKGLAKKVAAVKAYSVKVMATSVGSEPVRILAWVDKKAADPLAQAPPGSDLLLSGVIDHIQLTDGYSASFVTLDRCELKVVRK